MPVLYMLHKCPLRIVHKLNSVSLLSKLRALIRGSHTGHVTRPKGARLPYCLAALSRARDNNIIPTMRPFIKGRSFRLSCIEIVISSIG
jgi:hypothetical protein